MEGSRGDAHSRTFDQQYAAAQSVDAGVPEHVRIKCWEAAQKKFGKVPKRGHAPVHAMNLEYETRIKEWKSKCGAKIQQAQPERAATAVQAEVAPATLAAPVEVLNLPLFPYEAECWEDYCKESLESATHPENVTKAVKLVFDDKAVDISVPHGHKVLAASRSLGDGQARTKLMSRAINFRMSHPTLQRPVIFDIGAGASGVKAARHHVTGTLSADTIFWHCTLPPAGPADISRVAMFGEDNDYINWLSPSNPPKLGMVNVCEHFAHNCDCFRHYGKVYAMSVHSHYYFKDSDWHNIFKYTEEVATFSHVPECLDRPVPMVDPEFVWRRPQDAKTANWKDRAIAVLQHKLVGASDRLVFEPLATHGTTYAHRDPRIDLENGGFHMGSRLQREVNGCSDSLPALACAAAAQVAGGAALGYGAFQAYATRSPMPLLKGAFACAVGYLPSLAMQAAAFCRTSTTPVPGCEYTVKIVNGNAVALSDREEIAHHFKYIRAPLSDLERRITVRSYADMGLAKEMAETQLLSKKDVATTDNILLAKGLRAGKNEATIVDTAAAAAEMVVRMKTKNCPRNRPPPSWSPAIQALFCALGLLLAVQFALDCRSSFLMARHYALLFQRRLAIARAQLRHTPMPCAPPLPSSTFMPVSAVAPTMDPVHISSAGHLPTGQCLPPAVLMQSML